MAIAVGFYYLGVKADQPRIVVFSFVLLLYGLALALGGRQIFRHLFFPISFLFLMIPLNFLDEVVGFPLRQMVASLSTVLLNWLGIETVTVGTAIYSRVFHFDVADPCSGIRSLMALTTVTAAYAYVTQRVQWKRWVLFLVCYALGGVGKSGARDFHCVGGASIWSGTCHKDIPRLFGLYCVWSGTISNGDHRIVVEFSVSSRVPEFDEAGSCR